MSPHRALAILAIALTGCLDGEPLDLTVRVTIPAEVNSVPVGSLHLRVWSYDPRIIDGSATLSDHVITRFDHRTGSSTVLTLRSSSRIESGFEHYFTIDGCEATIEGSVWVLSDLYAEGPRPQVTLVPAVAPQPCPVASD